MVPDLWYTREGGGRTYVSMKLPVIPEGMVINQVTSFNSFASSPASLFLKIPTAVTFKRLWIIYSHHTPSFLSHAFVWPEMQGPRFVPSQVLRYLRRPCREVPPPGSVPRGPSLGLHAPQKSGYTRSQQRYSTFVALGRQFFRGPGGEVGEMFWG